MIHNVLKEFVCLLVMYVPGMEMGIQAKSMLPVLIPVCRNCLMAFMFFRYERIFYLYYVPELK